MFRKVAFLFIITLCASCSHDSDFPLAIECEQSLIEFNNEGYMFNEIQRLELSDYNGLSLSDKINILETDTRFYAYVIRDISRVYSQTNDDYYKKMAVDLIEIYISNFKINGILQSGYFHEGGYWFRDTFTRESYLLYQSYQYLNEEFILRAIEEQVALWLKIVPRNSNEKFMLFPYGIEISTLSPQAYEINPNQNLAVARLFSSLYFEPDSVYFKYDLFRDITFNEVEAALSLQNADGSLILREGLPLVLDSNYGGLASVFLYDLAQMWGNEEWANSLKRIGLWLYNDFPMSHPWNTQADYPNWRADRFTSYNLIGRLLSFYVADVDSDYSREWVAFIKQSFPNDNLRLETRWMEYLSIPRVHFLNKEIDFNLSPKVYVSDYDNTIHISIVAEHTSNYKVYVNGEVVNNSSSIEINSGEYEVLVEHNFDSVCYKYEEIVSGSFSKSLDIKLIDKDNKLI